VIAALLGIARAVPWWLWAAAALLAWGGWQRHQATRAADTLRAAEAKAAAEQIKAAEAARLETERRWSAQKGIADAAHARSRVLARDAAGARADADRVRLAAQSLAASAAAGAAAAAVDCQATTGAARLLAELLGRAVDRAAVLADHADAARSAGQACERAYDSLAKDVTP
jgi:Flp pilus assembly protein TadB